MQNVLARRRDGVAIRPTASGDGPAPPWRGRDGQRRQRRWRGRKTGTQARPSGPPRRPSTCRDFPFRRSFAFTSFGNSGAGRRLAGKSWRSNGSSPRAFAAMSTFSALPRAKCPKSFGGGSDPAGPGPGRDARRQPAGLSAAADGQVRCGPSFERLGNVGLSGSGAGAERRAPGCRSGFGAARPGHGTTSRRVRAVAAAGARITGRRGRRFRVAGPVARHDLRVPARL